MKDNKGFEKIEDAESTNNTMNFDLEKNEDKEFMAPSLLTRNFGKYKIFKYNDQGEPSICMGPHCNFS